MNMDCTGVGLITIDHLLVACHYPKNNTKNILEQHVMQGGGPVPTALAVLGKLGMRCELISKVGRDEMAEFLEHELDAFHVGYQHLVHEDGVQTPESFIVIDKRNGDRTIFLYRGDHPDLSPELLHLPTIAQSRLLHLDGRDLEASLQAARTAKENGVLVSIDIGSPRLIPVELLALLDIAVVSETYADAHLEKNNPLKSAKMLLNYGASIAAVTCGEHGSYWASEDTELHQPAFPVTVIDSTGAGDVFHGAALYGILNDFSLERTAAFAAATAAMACQKLGGKAGIPELDEIESFLSLTEV